jgi:hypothetical protein
MCCLIRAVVQARGLWWISSEQRYEPDDSRREPAPVQAHVKSPRIDRNAPWWEATV